MSFFAELQRRNVIRMAGLYLVGAWLTVQVAGTLLPMFGAPGWITRSLVIVLAIGLLPALVLAWVFEITPKGLKRDAEVPANESIAPQTARRMDRAIIVVLVCALAYFAVDKFALAPRREATLAAQVAAPVATAAATGQSRVDPHSIAVLPFVNMSSDKEQEYFSDGISEELLNLLAKVPGLRVIARTSSFSFKGKDTPIPEIARALNVAAVLEGSVRKSGDTVRVTAQLIRASDSSHLWSETYDRKLDDIFKVQDEIAATVVKQLQIKLLGAPPTSTVIDPKAFDEYLRGRALWNQRTEASVRKALVHFQNAARTAPDFALAFAGVADSYIILGVHGYESPRTMMPAAKAAAQHAIELDPGAGEPHASLGDIHFHYDWDWAASESEHQQALALSPAYATAYQWAAEPQEMTGNLDGAIANLRRARALDPLSMIIRSSLAHVLFQAGRRAEAMGELRQALTLDPDFLRTRNELARQLLFTGQADQALVEARRIVAANAGYLPGLATLGLCLGRTGQVAEARALLARLDAGHQRRYTSALELARISAALGDSESTLRYLEQAVVAREGYLPFIGGDEEFEFLRTTPRFLAIVHAIGVPRTAKGIRGP